MRIAAEEQEKRNTSGLDEQLSRLAEDVPPMPEDFRRDWRRAIREEAAGAAASGQKRPVRTGTAGWIRALSTAAVFVFLIGGTILYRNSKRPAAFLKTEAPKTEDFATGGAGNPEAPEPSEAETAAELPETEEIVLLAESYEEKVAAPAGFAMNAMPAAILAEGLEEADQAYAAEEDQIYEEEAEEEAEPVYAKEAAPVETPLKAPEATAQPAEPEEAETAEEAPEKAAEETVPDSLSGVGAFLKDMGDFVLLALPYLLGAAAVIGLVTVIRRKKTAERRG